MHSSIKPRNLTTIQLAIVKAEKPEYPDKVIVDADKEVDLDAMEVDEDDLVPLRDRRERRAIKRLKRRNRVKAINTAPMPKDGGYVSGEDADGEFDVDDDVEMGIWLETDGN